MSVTAFEGETDAQIPEAAAAANAAPGHAMGLFQSLQRLLSTIVGIVHTRVELLTTELQEEVHYAANLVLWSLIALFTGLLGLLLAGLTIVFAYWDTHRVLAAILVTAVYFLFALGAVLALTRKMKTHRGFLDGTLSELAKDSDALNSRIT